MATTAETIGDVKNRVDLISRIELVLLILIVLDMVIKPGL